METLYRTFKLQLEHTSTTFVRFLHDRIAWNSRLIAVLGARGVGKTTLLLQHIKLYDNLDEVLFVTADDFYFTTHRLFDLAFQFFSSGGKRLYIDEIHKYKGWSRELKNIYDQIPELNVVYIGSSVLDLEKGGADLSRRKVEYKLPGLSFREFVNLSQGWNLPSYSLDEILSGKVDFPSEEERPLKLFKEYLAVGYYPFFRETEYHLRLRSIIAQMVESDIPIFADMNVASSVKLKKLLYALAQSVPFKPNYAKLERDLEISRNTLPDYVNYLEKAGIINLLRERVQGMKLLEKVEKIYLNNTNMAYALSDATPDIGNIRETVFFSWMRVGYFVTSSSISDFEIDGRTFEVGGKNKTQRQIKQAKEGYVVKDDIEYVYQNTIPLWMFGFVY
ncbi:ATP-binding protein [Bacteroides sp.]|uniref:ATP-binding protein n=1 Tax=Bacteroides sp. TaxID=29523 RepID=UPI003AB10B58